MHCSTLVFRMHMIGAHMLVLAVRTYPLDKKFTRGKLPTTELFYSSYPSNKNMGIVIEICG